ncbi:glycine--tRNA ligase subunit beta [Marinobacter persicus]|jgi:glycyl-tRNA synthetase beta chain|uniref:Glycine--tRNA ligase beta subunit n=1 Tax=Marinobacter persicus TaxID=930118 RepID=A0A2S6G5I0_9GAMM|nr:glycine--tRNA ligase subunit beta [Marinobacter persicus]PPK51056.1 glycyl-tRNA synthetase beta chain [Marinobacter persicus]PPK54394.1 glycyl-tRNA synthetase beta chain [Marinobacter persicus]PPK57658.1 glycyl-tRNA synthetase beta chain [Marinobacter persicus]
MATQDFLVELGTEELPPKALKPLSDAFTQGIAKGLEDAGVEFGKVEAFAAPRRLAVRIRDLADAQPDKAVEKRGPAVKAAFDDSGNPTRALTGFATSLGITPDQLDTMETDKGAWVVYRTVEQGKPTVELLPELVDKSLAALPIPKRMRWGAHRTEFVRPVHWLIMLFGNKVIDTPIMNLTPGNTTRGHRFHCPKELIVPTPGDYEVVLKEEGCVLADFAERREQIRRGVTELAEKEAGGKAVISDDLLDEVTALNEWPVPLMGRFEERFLDVPAEALISSMEEHQKYFHVVAADGEMLPLFITVANIESKDPAQVISGNEKVIRPRLADAAFFYDTDRKSRLEDRIDALKPIVFQDKLGSIYDKSVRVAALAKKIADAIDSDPALAERAAMLAKTDLVTEMVLEFTDLQGIMGQYYAANDGEHEDVAKALNEQYMPRFAGDDLPSTLTGCAVAIADRIDSLVGLFGINQPPSGTRDPFGLRRASLGVLRIIIERELPLDLQTLCEWAEENFTVLTEQNTASTVVDYMLERFRAHYDEQGISAEVYLAVHARRPTRPLDFDRRVKAVEAFRQLPEAQALAGANKRVSNILTKQGGDSIGETVDSSLLQDPAEQTLAEQVNAQADKVVPLFEQGDYASALSSLASLRAPVDTFFDEVMVMADDEAVRNNRLALLNRLRNLFLRVADISLLPTAG